MSYRFRIALQLKRHVLKRGTSTEVVTLSYRPICGNYIHEQDILTIDALHQSAFWMKFPFQHGNEMQYISMFDLIKHELVISMMLRNDKCPCGFDSYDIYYNQEAESVLPECLLPNYEFPVMGDNAMYFVNVLSDKITDAIKTACQAMAITNEEYVPYSKMFIAEWGEDRNLEKVQIWHTEDRRW